MIRRLLTRHFDLTGRETLLTLLGAGIGMLLVITAVRFYIRDYRDAFLCLGVASVLAFVFFRKRKTLLAISALTWVLVNAGLTFLFHPSATGFFLTAGSAAGIYFVVRWSYKRYPYVSYKQKHIVFEGEAAMAAENARIEAEHRELMKKRPFGPWLFR
jgi:hypothetical protein